MSVFKVSLAVTLVALACVQFGWFVPFSSFVCGVAALVAAVSLLLDK